MMLNFFNPFQDLFRDRLLQFIPENVVKHLNIEILRETSVTSANMNCAYLPGYTVAGSLNIGFYFAIT